MRRRWQSVYLLATALALVPLVAALPLQDHFVGDFTASLNLVSPSYRAWRDPVALLLAFASLAALVRVSLGPRRLQLALGVAGGTLAAAVYIHEEDVHPFSCFGRSLCPMIFPPPDIWHDARSLGIMAAGFATALVLIVPRRWLVAAFQRARYG